MDSDAAFFSTAAEVIPVLFLILVFEARHEVTATPNLDLAIVGLATFALLMGEVAALHAISTGRPTDVDHTIVTLALVVGTGAIFILVMISRMLENAWLGAHRGTGFLLIAAYVLGAAVVLSLILT